MAFILEDEEVVKKPESFPQKIHRNLARSGARAVESIVGLPGDILNVATGSGEWLSKKLGATPEEIERLRESRTFLDPSNLFPSSEKIREKVSSKVGDKYLEPKNKVEAFSDDIVSDLAALMIPGKVKAPKSVRLINPFLKKLGIAAAGNIAKEGAKAVGAGEGAQQAIKLGAMVLTGAISRSAPKKLVSDLYKEADASIKGSPRIEAPELNKYVKNLKGELKQGLQAPSEKAVLSSLERLQSKIKNGKIGVKELWSSKRSINEEMAKALFETPAKGAKARAKNLYKGINRELNKELAKYGESNPEFGKAFQSAEDGYRALAKSQVIGNFARKHTNSKYAPMAAYLFKPIFGKIAAPSAATIGGYKGAQILYRISKSPTLRKYYKEVVQAAAQENAGAMNKSLSKLQNSLENTQKTPQNRYKLEEE